MYVLFVLIGLFVYFSITISPSFHWIMAFFPLLIPLVLILNTIFFFYWTLKRKILLIIVSFILMVLGYKFIERTYSIHYGDDKEGKLKLLSYNVRVFNNYPHLITPHSEPSQLISWVEKNDADIKCFQEFYNHPELESFHVIPKIKKNTPYYFFKPASVVHNQYFGLAIFSKYPIIKKGYIAFKNATFNQAIFADIVQNKDTIRVYNVHLQSMSINEKNLTPEYSKNSYNSFKDLFRRIRRGAIYRSSQTESLINHIDSCSYKIILAGDLNDTPYSYTYEILREKFNNGFEEKGNGFGFTYNGKLFFLRIDNIFSDKSITINTFKTRKDIVYSDHFPLELTFTF